MVEQARLVLESLKKLNTISQVELISAQEVKQGEECIKKLEHSTQEFKQLVSALQASNVKPNHVDEQTSAQLARALQTIQQDLEPIADFINNAAKRYLAYMNVDENGNIRSQA